MESDSDASIDAVQLLAKLFFRNITAFGPGKAMLEMSSVIDDFAEESRLRSVLWKIWHAFGIVCCRADAEKSL